MKPTGKSLKVLIVEDSQDDTLLIVDELKRGGLNPTFKRVESRNAFGDELSKDWDIIIADYSLPHFSGEEALNLLNESGADIPLIILSGSITDEIAVRLLKSGARDFITKDNLSRLVSAVQREIDEAQIRETQKRLRQVLTEKEELISAFFDSADESFIVLDKELRYIQVNPSYERRIGQTNEQLRGRKIVEVAPDIESTGRLEKYVDVIQTGKPYYFSNISTHTPMLGERKVNALAFKVGEGLGLVITDITEQKKLEEERENVNHLNEALARLYVPLTDPETSIKEIAEKVLIEAMDLTQSTDGYISEINELTGTNVVHKFSTKKTFNGVRKEELQSSNPDGVETLTREHPLTTTNPYYANSPLKHAASEALSSKNIPIFRHLAAPVSMGKILVGQIVLANSPRDYTENDLKTIERIVELFGTALMKKRIQAALKRSEAEKSSILNSMKDVVSLKDYDHNFVWGNDALVEMLGVPLSQLIGKKCYIEAHHISEPCEGCTLREVFETGRGTKRIRRFVDGSIRETWSEPVRDETGKTTSVIEISRDVTDLLRYEDRLEALHVHAAKLSMAQTVKEISDISLEVMSTIFNFKFMSFLEVQNETLVGVGSMGAPLSGAVLTLDGKGITVKAATTKKTVRINDLRDDEDFFRGSTDSLSELAVPIIVDDHAVAVLNAESDKVNAFSEQDQRLLEILSNHVASAIHRIRSREELTDSEIFTQIILNEVPDGIYLTDMDNQIIEVNQAIPRILGYSRSELIGRNISILETPKFWENFPVLRENLLKNGRNLFESEILAKNGEIIPVEISTRLITYKGKPAVIGISRDLRERRKNEAKLKESEELYRTILENSPNPVGITVDGKVVYANPSRLRLTGVSSFSEIEGEEIFTFVHPDDAAVLREKRIISLEEGDSPQSYEFRVKKGNGAYAQIEAISTPIKFKGQQAVLHVLHDVTQRKNFEKRLASLHEYARNLALSTNMTEAAQVVGDAVQGILETSFGSVSIIAGDVLRFLHIYGVNWNEKEELPINGRGVTTRAARTGDTQLIPDVTKDPDYIIVERQTHPSRSEIAVPIKINEKVVAVINIENTKPNAYDWSDVRIIEMLGNHFSTAIQRIRNAESLKESERSYKSLFEGVNDAIYIHDFNGNFINVNPIAEQTLGYSLDELQKMNLADIDSETDQSLIQQRMDELVKRGHKIFEVTHVAKDGTRIVNEVNARVIDYEGKSAVLSACRNIAERRRYIEQLHNLHDYAVRLGQASDINTVYDITFKEMEKTINCRRCGVLIRENGVLNDVYVGGFRDEAKWKLPLDGKGIVVRAARIGETVCVSDVREDPDYIEAAPGVDIRSEIAVPVKIRDDVVAVLNVERSEVAAFTDADRGLLEILANHTSSALIRLAHVNELTDHEKRLLALNECASELATTETMDQVWDVTLNLIKRELKHDFAGIGVVIDEYLEYIRYLGVSPTGVFRLPLTGSGITVRAIRTGKTQLVNDVINDEDFVVFDAGDSGPINTRSELVVPIKLDEKPYAIINIESTQLKTFNDNDRSLLEILAKHVEEAMNRIRYVDELQFEEAQMASLHKFTNRLAEATTFSEAGAIAADSLKKLLSTTNGSLSFVEDGALHHRYIYGVELAEEYLQPLDGPGITVRAAVTGEPQIVADVRNDPSYRIPEGVEISTRSELAVPVKLEGRVVAVINAESPIVEAFTPRDKNLLEILAMHLSSAFTRIRDSESKEKYRNRLESLNILVTKLDTAQSPIDTARIAKEMIHNLSAFDYANLALIEGDELVAVPLLENPQLITRLSLKGRGLSVKAVNEQRIIYIEDVEKEPDFVKGYLDTQSELVVPLFVGNKVIGVLNIESTRKNAFGPDDIKLAETIGLHIASTLERLHRDAERLEAQLQLQKKEYEADQARELERMKTRFISTATHEIRTPLTSIKGYTELIQGELKTGEIETTKRYFDVVERNVDRLVHLTDDLLDTQRIDEDRMTLKPTTFKTMILLKDLIAEMTPLLSRRNQTLTISKTNEGDIRGDRSRLMQVLVNLVTNASKFSPEGSVIHISVEKHGSEVTCRVMDQGIGLVPEDMPKLFKPFPAIRVEGNPEGTGLGLSICKGIVELHGGRIWAESPGRNKGSTFSFTIPEAKK